MNRIIVTGGAGFIGSAVARHIINDTPDAVCVVDKLTYAGNLENLATIAKSDRFKFEKVDICDRDELDRVFVEFKPTHVMHLAAESHVDRSIDGPGEFIQTNIVYKLDEDSDSIGKKKEYFRFPGETLFDVEGDCDCKAVLAYGLFKRLGVDVDLVVVKANESDEYNHAAVVFKNKPEAPVKLPPGFKEYAPGKGYYCELTGEGFHPGDIPPEVDPASLVRVPRP